MMNLPTLQDCLHSLRQKHPLVYCLTNQVAMEWTANLLLAVEASPLMSASINEVDDLAHHADALLLNIGTIEPQQLQLMLRAGQTMHTINKPIVLDPVGVAASQYRLAAAQQIILTCHPACIRGNASEIAALTGYRINGHGVDSTLLPQDVLPSAQDYATSQHCVIAISGETDYITDGTHTATVQHGSPLMTYVTGMGCAESALMAAIAAVHTSYFDAAYQTMLLMASIGEKVANDYPSPGMFKTQYIDHLYQLAHYA